MAQPALKLQKLAEVLARDGDDVWRRLVSQNDDVALRNGVLRSDNRKTARLDRGDSGLPRGGDSGQHLAQPVMSGDRGEPRRIVDPAAARKIAIDLVKLSQLSGQPFEMLIRFLKMIQVQRQDFNGRVLTIRRDDMRAIAAILGVGEEHADRRLDDLGLKLGSAPAEPVDASADVPAEASEPNGAS